MPSNKLPGHGHLPLISIFLSASLANISNGICSGKDFIINVFPAICTSSSSYSISSSESENNINWSSSLTFAIVFFYCTVLHCVCRYIYTIHMYILDRTKSLSAHIYWMHLLACFLFTYSHQLLDRFSVKEIAWQHNIFLKIRYLLALKPYFTIHKKYT